MAVQPALQSSVSAGSTEYSKLRLSIVERMLTIRTLLPSAGMCCVWGLIKVAFVTSCLIFAGLLLELK